MTMHATFSFRRTLAFGLLGALALSGCDKPTSMGDANQILVVAPQAVWETLEEDIREVLEPSTFTVRDERIFDVGHTEPEGTGWASLRVMRQILLIGDPSIPVVEQALSAYRGATPTPPASLEIENVWARQQQVILLLLPPGASPEDVLPLLPEIGGRYLQQFDSYARARMFASRPNTELSDSLSRNAGFSMTFPQVYRATSPEPGVYEFRNDQPDPSRLIRHVTVASRPRGEVERTAEVAATWRSELAARLTQPPQVTELPPEAVHAIEAGGLPALQIQGVWSNPPDEWPAAGAFLTRLVECPDRLFLLDAWLYAPGVAKYEYMFQLNTILDSFRCAEGG